MTNAIEAALRRTASHLDSLSTSSPRQVSKQRVAAAERLEVLPGLMVPVARAGHLAVLTLLACDDETRPQDAADLLALRPVLSARDRTMPRRPHG